MICYTVSDINKFIKQLFSHKEMLCNISVKGEISNFIHHKSGHMYFTLRDASSSIECIMFCKQTEQLEFLLKNGMLVVVRGNIGIYEKDGVYQIYVSNMIEDGPGLIKKDLDDLTLKLMREGLFDSDKKRPIPEKPKIVGVVTAPNGAALQDIIQVLSRRMPMLKIKVYPAVVQGEKAVDSIVSALKFVAIDAPDVLIIGRGGGSIEDLSAFNSEIVVREVYRLEVPVISAVGHETDRCLLDLVADLRAPTPSAAAELVCLDIREIKSRLDDSMNRIEMCMKSILNTYDIALYDFKQRLDYLSPYHKITCLYERLDQFSRALNSSIGKYVEKNSCKLTEKKILLDSLSPFGVLKRGYSIVIDSNNNIVSSVEKLSRGDVFRVKFIDGECSIKFVEKL